MPTPISDFLLLLVQFKTCCMMQVHDAIRSGTSTLEDVVALETLILYNIHKRLLIIRADLLHDVVYSNDVYAL